LGNCYNLYKYGNVCGSKLMVQNIQEDLDKPDALCPPVPLTEIDSEGQ
jgi:hypothetical protein